MARQAAKLPRAKIALIHVARQRLGLEEADYRLLLLQVAGVESSRDLSAAGFRAVMEAFAALGFVSDRAVANFGRRPGMATPGEVSLIRGLWNDYTGGSGCDASLGKWLEKHWRVSALRFLPAEAAPKAIAALRAMKARRRRQSAAAGGPEAA